MLLIIVSLTQSHHKMKSENKAQQRIKKKSGCVVLIKILLVADNFLVYDLLVFTPW